MALETGTYISDLVITNPTSTDPKSEGDNHLRLIKATLKATFPNVTGAVSLTHDQLNLLGVSQLAGLRNKIINGNFDVWQRGTSLTVSSGYSGQNFIADRFFSSADSGSSGSFTISQQTFTPGQTDVPYEPAYFYRMATSSLVNGTNGFTYLAQQRIEDVRTFAGQTVTVSFYAKASAAATICLAFAQSFGTGGSGAVLVAPVTRSLTTSWQKITATFAIPSISGKTIGTSSSLRFEILSALRGTTAATYGVTAFDVLATGSYDTAQVQIEVGSVATPFEQRTVGFEDFLCRRYYQRLTPGASAYFPGSGWNYATTGMYSVVTFSPPLRAAPTSVEQSGTASDYRVAHANTFTNCSAVPTFSAAGPYSALLIGTVASGLTIGQAAILGAATSSGYLGFSAEL